jgi:hypothetical protein
MQIKNVSQNEGRLLFVTNGETIFDFGIFKNPYKTASKILGELKKGALKNEVVQSAYNADADACTFGYNEESAAKNAEMEKKVKKVVEAARVKTGKPGKAKAAKTETVGKAKRKSSEYTPSEALVKHLESAAIRNKLNKAVEDLKIDTTMFGNLRGEAWFQVNHRTRHDRRLFCAALAYKNHDGKCMGVLKSWYRNNQPQPQVDSPEGVDI